MTDTRRRWHFVPGWTWLCECTDEKHDAVPTFMDNMPDYLNALEACAEALDTFDAQLTSAELDAWFEKADAALAALKEARGEGK